MISKEKVREIADLAQLTLTSEEEERLQKELSHTLDYIEVLDELETDDVPATYQVTGLENVLRDDKREDSLTQEEALSGTEEKKGGLFKVSSIFDE